MANSLIYENPTDYQQTLTPEQVQAALAQSGLSPEDQARIAEAFVQNATENAQTSGTPSVSTASTAAPSNPGWIYAVNMPSTYPDFAAMKAAGSGLVIADDDPNYAILVSAARQWGVPVAVNVAAHNGETPEAYAARVQAAQAIAPSQLVLDIEAVGKGYKGSEGWKWSQQAATLLKPVVGSTQVAVSMEPNQSDYNYGAFQDLSSGGSTQYWVQSYTGDMTPYDPNTATAPARAAVGSANVVTIFAPGVRPPSGYGGSYVSYGIPQTGVSAAGIYGKTPAPGVAPPQNPANTSPPTGSPAPGPQLTPVGGNTTPAHGHGGAPAIPGEIPTTGPTPPGSPAPPGSGLPGAPTGGHPGQSTGTGSNANPSNTNWAAAYFASFGLPPDVANKVNEIFQQYPDTDQAIQFALAYIRGTPWYAQTFPGIQNGMQHGLISNEQEYRQYVTGIDTLAQRYLGRHISGTEIADYLYNGLTPEIVGKQYEGQANLEANFKDYAYYTRNFGDPDLQNLDTDSYRSLANEQVGLDSPLGQKLNRALQTAMQRAQKVFEGQAATPSLSLQNGLSAPSLSGRAGKPDVAA